MFCSFIFFLGFFVLLVFFCKKEMIFIKLTNNVKKKKNQSDTFAIKLN